MRAWTGALLGGLSMAASATVSPIPVSRLLTRTHIKPFDDPYRGNGQFPQFRDISGLPGDGFGLLVDGTPSIEGAMALSTPIAFSLGNDIFDFGGGERSDNGFPQAPNFSSGAHNPSSGKLQGMVGVGTPIGHLTGTYEVLSAELDQVYNLELQLPLHWDKGGVAIGVQNLTNRHNAAADKVPGETALSRSEFLVGTYEFSPHDYVSLGWGDVRYKGPFGNVSVLVAPRFKVTTEYDTFGFNSGAAYSFGGFRGMHNTELTLWAGYVQERVATIELNFAF